MALTPASAGPQRTLRYITGQYEPTRLEDLRRHVRTSRPSGASGISPDLDGTTQWQGHRYQQRSTTRRDGYADSDRYWRSSQRRQRRGRLLYRFESFPRTVPAGNRAAG